MPFTASEAKYPARPESGHSPSSFNRRLAQLVERRSPKPKVEGSIPSAPAILLRKLRRIVMGRSNAHVEPCSSLCLAVFLEWRVRFIFYEIRIRHAAHMYYVYLLRSLSKPSMTYVGFTAKKIEVRLSEHNEGLTRTTAPHVPWELETFVGFTDFQKARDFEVYLKGGSGYVFAKRHLWSEAVNPPSA